MAVAFFDLDKTLLAVNSGTLWVRRELALGHITRMQALRASLWLARYHLGFVAMEDALARPSPTSRAPRPGHPGAHRAFYAAAGPPLYRPGALRAVEEHRGAGDRLVLLTSSSGYLSELVARGSAPGRHPLQPLRGGCAGAAHRPAAGRRVLRRRQAHPRGSATPREAGVPLAACSFYTDSYSDLPVMEVVGRPVAVHPDHRLRREALRRGWPVVDWGVPARAAPGRRSARGSADGLRRRVSGAQRRGICSLMLNT